MNLSKLPNGSTIFDSTIYPCLNKGKFLQLNNIFPLGTPPFIEDNKLDTYLGIYRTNYLVIPLKLPTTFISMKSFSQYITDSTIDYTNYPLNPSEVFWIGQVKGYITNKLGTTLRLYIPKFCASFTERLAEGLTPNCYTFPVPGKGSGITTYFAIIPLTSPKDS
jgi:hypothetical protein